MKRITVIFLSFLRPMFDALLLPLFSLFPYCSFCHFLSFFLFISSSHPPPHFPLLFPSPFCPFENTNPGNTMSFYNLGFEEENGKVLTNFICPSCICWEPTICGVLCRQESSNPEQEAPILWQRHTCVHCLSLLSPTTEFKGSLGKHPWSAWWTEVSQLYVRILSPLILKLSLPTPWISSSFLVENGCCPPREHLSTQVIPIANHCGQWFLYRIRASAKTIRVHRYPVPLRLSR